MGYLRPKSGLRKKNIYFGGVQNDQIEHKVYEKKRKKDL